MGFALPVWVNSKCGQYHTLNVGCPEFHMKIQTLPTGRYLVNMSSRHNTAAITLDGRLVDVKSYVESWYVGELESERQRAQRAANKYFDLKCLYTKYGAK